MTKLSTESYKGVRDFYPEDKFIQEYIFEKMREVVEAFGYQKYDSSILEPTELYKAKSSEEIINEQTYTFTDRGGREVTLRPEMTPTLARMIAGKKRELTFPLRWYSIPNFFRYERPQKGRQREFWQLNVDVFGIEGIEAEIETILIAYNIMINLGAINVDFVIKISYAGLIGMVLSEKFNLNERERKDMIRLIDKWNGNKIKDKEFNEELGKFLGKERGEELKKSLANGEIQEIMESRPETQKCKKVIEKLKQKGITNVAFDPFLVRGFDYYTGIVFEVFDKNPENNRAMFGGGRYDNLLDIFGAEKVPAVGFGMGDVTALEFLKSRGLTPISTSKTDLYICIIDQRYTDFADNLAKYLREQNLNVEVDYTYIKVGDQVKKADKKQIYFTICIGEDELKTEKFTLKRLIDGQNWKISKEEIKGIIKN